MRISILGCGWLGLPLGKYLLQKGHLIKGSTTDKDKLKNLEASGIQPFLLVLDPKVRCDDISGFFDTDLLIINIPPERREDIVDFHTNQINALIDEIKKAEVKKVLFTSSTSVYPEVNCEVTETDDLEPSKDSGKALRIAEGLLMSQDSFQTTVLRLAGLVGFDRNPRQFLKKRRVIHKVNSPVNLVHRDDCVRVINLILEKNLWGEIFNVCSDEHPLRIDFYKKEAGLADIEIPDIDMQPKADYKIVSNKKLKEITGYNFIYPNPMNMD